MIKLGSFQNAGNFTQKIFRTDENLKNAAQNVELLKNMALLLVTCVDYLCLSQYSLHHFFLYITEMFLWASRR